jgi:hypothetical protein
VQGQGWRNLPRRSSCPVGAVLSQVQAHGAGQLDDLAVEGAGGGVRTALPGPVRGFPDATTVSGHVYDVTTGLITTVIQAAPVHAGTSGRTADSSVAWRGRSLVHCADGVEALRGQWEPAQGLELGRKVSRFVRGSVGQVLEQSAGGAQLPGQDALVGGRGAGYGCCDAVGGEAEVGQAQGRCGGGARWCQSPAAGSKR